MKFRMFWGKYKCPSCGHNNLISTRRGYDKLTICMNYEAMTYHLYGEKAPRRCYKGFKGSIFCKKCNAEISVDQHSRWSK